MSPQLKNTLYLLVIVLISAYLIPTPTDASCAPLTLEEQVAQVNTIILGTITNINNNAATVTVEEKFKGTPHSTITVTGQQSPDAITSIDVTFEQGKRYLLFLDNLPNGTYQTNQCTGTRMVPNGLSLEEQRILSTALLKSITTGTPSPPTNNQSNEQLVTAQANRLLPNQPALLIGILVAGFWELIWKGVALWHAARYQQKGWFIALLVLNTFGILSIIYLLITRSRIKSMRSESKKM